MTLKQDHISFVSKECPDANLMIDYLDIVAATKLLIPNHDSIDHEDRYVRLNYRYDIMIQIELSAVNGLSALSKKGSQESEEGARLDK